MIPVIIDTREQRPFIFKDLPVEAKIGTLHTADYSIQGFEDRFCLERKSLGDLAGCMTVGRERFEHELERMKEYESACVVVEEPITAIRTGQYRSNLNPISFEQGILSFMVRYRVPFLFGHDREYAEWLAFNCIRHYWNKTVSRPKDKIGFIQFQRRINRKIQT